MPIRRLGGKEKKNALEEYQEQMNKESWLRSTVNQGREQNTAKDKMSSADNIAQDLSEQFVI